MSARASRGAQLAGQGVILVDARREKLQQPCSPQESLLRMAKLPAGAAAGAGGLLAPAEREQPCPRLGFVLPSEPFHSRFCTPSKSRGNEQL